MSREGSTIVEVLLAATLLSVGLASVAGITAAAARAMTTAWALEDGAAAIQGVVDSLSTVTVGGGGSREDGAGVLTWSVDPGHGARGWVRYEHPVLDEAVDVSFATDSGW